MKKFLFKSYFGITPAMLALFLITSVLLNQNAHWDLDISSLFYRPREGFYLGDRWWAFAVYRGVHILGLIMVFSYILFIIISYIKKSTKLMGIARKTVIFLLVSFAVGPGIIVNYVLKDNSGRARPANIVEFGGRSLFTPPFVISDQCTHNCSFVSGHASFGFYFICLGFIASAKRKKIAGYTVGVSLGLTIGLVRIIQGRHFFSDVILAFFFVYFSTAVIYYIMYERKKLSNSVQ